MNIWDLVVNISGNGQDFRDDVRKDRDELDKLFAELRDKTLAINVDDADAEYKLEVFKRQLDDLRDASAKLELHDQAAKDELEAFKLKLADLRNAAVAIDLNDEGAKTKLDLLKVKLDELQNPDIKPDVNLEEADLKLDEFKQKLRDIQETHALIKVNDEKAQAEVDKLKMKLDDIAWRTMKITADDTDAQTKLDDLSLKLDKLRTEYTKLPIGVEDGSAIEKIDAIKMDLATLHDEKINITVDGPDVAATDAKMVAEGEAAGKAYSRGFSNGSRGGGGKRGAGMLMGILGALGVGGASPVGAAAVGAAGGLASAAAPGLVGAAGLFAVITSNVTKATAAETKLKSATAAVAAAQAKVKGAQTYQQWLTATQNLNAAQAKLRSTQASIGPAVMQTVDALKQWHSFWGTYTSSLQSPALAAFRGGLKLLEGVLSGIKPAIKGAASGFASLEKSASKALSGSFWKSFFRWMGGAAKGSIVSFGKTLGNLATGFAALLKAFSPMAKVMEKGLVTMTKHFADWAKSLQGTKSFKEFLSYAKANGGSVMSLLGNLAGIVGALLKHLAPAGAALLKFVADLAGLVKQLLQTNPIIKELLDAALGIAKNVFSAADAVVRFLSWLGKAHPVIMDVITALAAGVGAVWAFNIALDANPISLIIIGIALLIAGIVELVKHWHNVTSEAKKLWNDLKADFTGIKTDLIKLWTELWTHIKGYLKKIGLTQYLKAYWNTMKGAFKVVLDLFKGDWSAAWTAMKASLSKIWDDIKKTTLGKMLTDAKNWGANLVKMIAKGIESAIGSVEKAASNVASKIKSLLGFGSPTEEGPGATSDRWAPNFVRMYVDGLKSGIPAIQAALSQVLLPPDTAAMVQQSGQRFAAAAAGGITVGAPSIALHIHGNLYGVEDLQGAVQPVIDSSLSKFAGAVKQVGRTSGVSK